jgi:hypothetical protein
MQIDRKSLVHFVSCLDCENKIAWSDSKVLKSQMIKRDFWKSYKIWTSHGEIDDALLEVDIGGVGDDNSHG